MKTAFPGPSLLKWYAVHKRDLPWRHTKDPYTIWISEIILQQTRVDQGLGYFNRFLAAYPVVAALAAAPEEEVLKLWQGLGYYSRARNLHATAKTITDKYKGIFPQEYKELLTLKGIGSYTASAIASFAFNKPHAVLDGNVFRFLSRYFGIDVAIDGPQAKKEFGNLASNLLDKADPATYNQAIMEFGALQCRPGLPLCEECPLVSTCCAFAAKKVIAFPVKSKKLKVRSRFFNYLHIEDADFVFINRRGNSDIWEGLYDFPMLETDQAIEPEELMKSLFWKKLFQAGKGVLNKVSKTYVHKLSHQTIHAVFYELCMEDLKKMKASTGLLVAKNTLGNYPIPRLIDLYLQSKN